MASEVARAVGLALVLGSGLLSALPAAAAEDLEPRAGELAARVDAYLAPLLDEDLISGSVLIARGGRIEVARGYGPAQREYGVACTPETRHRLASMSKQFTAAAILLLEEEGRLSVADTLGRFLPGYPHGGEITLHHLLTHTSGVINYSALPDHYRVWCMPHTIDEVIARFRDEPLRFSPGAQFEYSNSGYVLLAKVIEQVSGLGYEEFLRRRIFAPLGMHDSGVDADNRILPQRAQGYYKTAAGLISASYLYMEYTNGAGSLYSTVLDLYKWDRALYTDTLLSAATRERMFTPYAQTYGYGWFTREEWGHKLVEHRGGINGFLTMIQRFVDDDVVVITLFNFVSTFARDVNRGLAALALGLPCEPALVPEGVEVGEEALAACAGDYQIPEGPVLRLRLRDGELWAEAGGEPEEQAVPQSEWRYYLRRSNALLVFRPDEAGTVAGLSLLQSETVLPCRRISAGGD